MANSKKLLYLHGFGSSAASGMVRTLRELLTDFQVIAPDIPVDPAEALPFLRGLCMNEVPDVVIGTNMGGMYEQNEFFRTALISTRGKALYHSQGEQDPYKTILTEEDFCGKLTELRDNPLPS